MRNQSQKLSRGILFMLSCLSVQCSKADSESSALDWINEASIAVVSLLNSALPDVNMKPMLIARALPDDVKFDQVSAGKVSTASGSYAVRTRFGNVLLADLRFKISTRYQNTFKEKGSYIHSIVFEPTDFWIVQFPVFLPLNFEASSVSYSPYNLGSADSPNLGVDFNISFRSKSPLGSVVRTSKCMTSSDKGTACDRMEFAANDIRHPLEGVWDNPTPLVDEEGHMDVHRFTFSAPDTLKIVQKYVSRSCVSTQTSSLKLLSVDGYGRGKMIYKDQGSQVHEECSTIGTSDWFNESEPEPVVMNFELQSADQVSIEGVVFKRSEQGPIAVASKVTSYGDN